MPDVPLTRPVPLSDFNLAELRRMVALGHATPGQAAALFGIDRQAAEALCRPATRPPAPGRSHRRPDRRRPA